MLKTGPSTSQQIRNCMKSTDLHPGKHEYWILKHGGLVTRWLLLNMASVGIYVKFLGVDFLKQSWEEASWIPKLKVFPPAFLILLGRFCWWLLAKCCWKELQSYAVCFTDMLLQQFCPCLSLNHWNETSIHLRFSLTQELTNPFPP